jgi:hypothetical protein
MAIYIGCNVQTEYKKTGTLKWFPEGKRLRKSGNSWDELQSTKSS